MIEYLNRAEVLGKLDEMIAYYETRDDCWTHTLQVAKSAIMSIEPVKKKESRPKICECWEQGSYIAGYDTCRGTKEREPCECKGDRSKCDFYDNVRESADEENI